MGQDRAIATFASPVTAQPVDKKPARAPAPPPSPAPASAPSPPPAPRGSAVLFIAAEIARGLGSVPAGTIVVTGPYLQGAGPGPGAMHPLSGPEDARRMVRYWAEEGVTWFKAYTQISRADLQTLPYEVLEPIVFIFFTVLSLNFLGDVVRARFDVRESAI